MFSVLILVPMVVLVGLLGLVVGPEMAIAAAIIDIRTYDAPPGRWDVVRFKAGVQFPALGHSSVYESDEIVLFVCNWIKTRASR
jgi:hypothetical protein